MQKVIAFLLILCALVDATHFRYGHITWEKDVTHPNPAEYKVRVNYDIGARWSYPWGAQGTTCPPLPFVATGTTGSGNCPTIGVSVPFGVVTFDLPVKINTASTGATTFPFVATVTSIIPELDMLYGVAAFDITFPTTLNPVTVDWSNCCRLSELLDGNNDQNWRLKTIIDASLTNTKSPKSASLPVVSVYTGRNNSLFFPSVAFDNNVNRIRVATLAESSLITDKPNGFSLSTTVPGAANFLPSVSGLYAIQLIITSFDSSSLAKSSAALDLLLEAKPFSAIAPVLTLTTDSELTQTVSVGSTLTFTLTSILEPALSSYTISIINTPLPLGASVSPLIGSGNTATLYQFSWTPTLTSVSSIVCFQSIATTLFNPSILSSLSMLCININIDALPTMLTTFPAAGVCGGPVTVSALLQRTADNLPLANRPVSFSSFDGVPLCSNTWTNATGVAQCTFIASELVKALPYLANFLGVNNEFLPSSSTFLFTISTAATTFFTNLVLISPASVGYPLSVSAVLNRIFNDGAMFAPSGQVVNFTVTKSSLLPTVTISGQVSGTNGLATATFSPPTESGSYNLSAMFSGSECLIGPSSTSMLLTVYQRTRLSIRVSPFPVCGVGFVVTAHLETLPNESAEPISNAYVMFSFPIGPVQSVLTDDNGDASVTYLVSQAMINAFVTATFDLTGGLYSNHDGLLSWEIATVPVSVAAGSTSLILTVPPTGTVMFPLPVSALLTNTAAGNVPIAGANLVFTLTFANGIVMTRFAITNSNGEGTPVSPLIPANTGLNQVSVSFDGNSCLSPAAHDLLNVNVNLIIPTQIVTNPINAVCGSYLSVTARLISTVGAPISGQSLQVVDNSLLLLCLTGPTDSNGFASCNFIPEKATNLTNSSSTYTVMYDGIPGVYGLSSLSQIFNVAKASTAFFAISVLNVDFVGDTIAIKTALSRTSSPSSGPIPLVPVVVEYHGPGQNQVRVVVTDFTGGLSTDFSTLAQGVFTITVSYAGDSCTYPTLTTATVTVYQKTYLVVNDAHGFCGAATVILAGLHALPSNTSLGGLEIDFVLTGNPAVASLSALTDNMGIATISAVYPAPGTFLALAEFSNFAAYFVDDVGNFLPTLSSANVIIGFASTSLADLPLPSTYYVGDAIPVLTILTRTTPPVLTVVGALVTFISDGLIISSQTTDVNGLASTILSADHKGAINVLAQFQDLTPNPTCLLGSNSVMETINVYQKSIVSFIINSPLTCGLPGTLGAQLMSTNGTPLTNQSIVFDFLGVLPGLTVITDNLGIAKVSSLSFSSAGAYIVHVSFFNIVGFYANRNGLLKPDTDMTLLSVGFADSSISLGIASPFNSLMGNAITLRAQLSPPIHGATLQFIVPSLPVLMSTTGIDGTTMVTFSPVKKGYCMVSARFDGDGCFRASSATTMASTVYQQVELILYDNRAFGDAIVCGQTFTLTASLRDLSSGAPISNEAIQFDFGGVIPPLTAITIDGIATVTSAFSDSGSFPITAQFFNPFAFYTNHLGVIPAAAEIAVGTATIIPAESALSNPLLSVNYANVGDSITISSILSRVSAPVKPVSGNIITLTLGSVASCTAITNSFGLATCTMTLAVPGVFAVKASFDGDSCLNSQDSFAPTMIIVTQRVVLTLTPSTSICGVPVPMVVKLLAIPKNTPLVNMAITVLGAGFSCIATTGSDGSGTCSLPLPAGNQSLTADFNLTGFSAAHVVSFLAVEKSVPIVKYSGGLVLPNRHLTVLTAKLTTSTGVPIVGRNVNITAGSGFTLQKCWAKTDMNGVATCTPNVWLIRLPVFRDRFQPSHSPSACVTILASIVKVLKDGGCERVGRQIGSYLGPWVSGGGKQILNQINLLKGQLIQPLGPIPVSVTFSGDACFQQAVDILTITMFEFLEQGTFVIGDRSTGPYYFYGPLWAQRNRMSVRNASNSDFIGFAADLRTSLGQAISSSLTCSQGQYYNSNRQQELPDESDIPPYMAVVVSTTTAYNPSTGPGGLSTTHDCSIIPCQSGGTCVNNYGGGFFCLCKPNHKGTMCQQSGTTPTYGNGNGMLVHGTGNPGDTTGDINKIIVLKYTDNSFPFAGSGTFVASYCP